MNGETECLSSLVPKYIIVDIENYRYKAEHGWTTQEIHAKLFNKDEMHIKIKKLREDNFKKITFKRVEIPKEDKKKQKHLETVKTAVKLVIEEKKEIIRMTEKVKEEVSNQNSEISTQN